MKTAPVLILPLIVVSCLKSSINTLFKIKTALWLILDTQQYYFASEAIPIVVFIANFWILHFIYIYALLCLLTYIAYKFVY